MAVEAQELRKVHWIDTFGFVRIFQTLRPSLGFGRLLLGTACVLACWLVGWTMDRLWLAGGLGVLTQRGPLTADVAPGLADGGYDRTITELDRYAHADRNELRRWRANVTRSGGTLTGPFQAAYGFFGDCFAAGIHGVFTGRILIDPDGRDSLLGAASRTLSGITWLVTQHPWFTAIYGLLHIAIFSLFGTAICRQAAVQTALRGRVELTAAFRFSKEKINETALVPLILIGLVVACAAILVLLGLVGGLLSVIPMIGHLIATGAYLIALLIGVAAAALIIALIVGIHLVCPSMGAEGSDWSDTLTRAIPYFLARPWHFAFYSLAGLAYGAFGFVVVRLFVIILLKFTHKFTAIGLGWFGGLSGTDKTLGRLPTMWQLPAWSEITLIPTGSGPDWWGTFHNAAQMSTGENLGAWMLSVWVGLLVAGVGGFVVSYYFTVCTEIYLLLRRHVDGTPIEDVFFEDPELEYGSPTAPEASTPAQHT